MTEFFRAIAKIEPNSDNPIIDNYLFSKILTKRESNKSVNIHDEEIAGIESNPKYINLM
jgi:hypothetical protein